MSGYKANKQLNSFTFLCSSFMVDVTVKFPLKNKFLFEGPFEKLAQKREDDECDETYEYELILTNPSGSMIEEPCHKATSESVEIGESSEEIHNGQPLALKHSSDSEQKVVFAKYPIL